MGEMRRLLAVVLGCSVAGALGCLDLGRTTAPRPAPMDSTLVLHLREELAPDARTLWLDCQTIRIYGCFNYEIEHVTTISGRTISVLFTGVTIGPICLTALGPARARIPLGSLAEGSYALRLTARGAMFESRLDVTADAYAVSPAHGPSTDFPVPVLRRVPDGTIWGVVGWDVAAKDPLVYAYLDSLRSAGAVRAAFTPGDYGYFRVDPLGNIVQPGGSGYHFALAYLYRFGGDTSSLPEVIRTFADPLSISLYTDRGESYFSWLLRAAAAGAARRGGSGLGDPQRLDASHAGIESLRGVP